MAKKKSFFFFVCINSFIFFSSIHLLESHQIADREELIVQWACSSCGEVNSPWLSRCSKCGKWVSR